MFYWSCDHCGMKNYGYGFCSHCNGSSVTQNNTFQPIIDVKNDSRIINTMCKRTDDENDGKVLEDWFKKELKELIKEAMFDYEIDKIMNRKPL